MAGSDVQGKVFVLPARTLVLSRFGAKISLARELGADQEIMVTCPSSGQESGARVVALLSKSPQECTYGIELMSASSNFWNVPFPPGPAGQDLPGIENARENGKEKGMPAVPSNPEAPMNFLTVSAARAPEAIPRRTTRNYAVRLACPEGDQEQWMFLQDRTETLKSILDTAWDFRCTEHGWQRAFPLEATETLLQGQPVIRKKTTSAPDPSTLPRGTLGRRKEYRHEMRIRVRVRGKDPRGHPFEQTAYTVDVSRHGGRLECVGALALPGTVIEVRWHWRSALFRVVWAGQVGTREFGQIGITSLQPDHNIWGLPQS